MKKLLLAFLLAPLLSFGQSDTTALADSIWANFPDNTSGFITPERLRNVALELSISNANLFERNVFSEAQEVQDSIKTTDGFYTWNGSAWESVENPSDTATWARSGGFILPVEYNDKLRVDTFNVQGLVYPTGNVNLGTRTAPFDTTFINVIGGLAGQHNTLDEAYDEDGSGAGRVITADNGAVEIQGNFISENIDFNLVNDTFYYGANAMPFAGTADSLGGGLFGSGVGNLGPIGLSDYSWFSGYITATGNSNIKGDTVDVTIECPGNLIMQTDDENTNWSLGYSSFGEEATSADPFTATMYVLRNDMNFDTQVLLMDTMSSIISSHYAYTDDSNGAFNKFRVDSAGIQLTYGETRGTPTWTPSSYELSLLETGLKYVDGNQANGKVLKSDASGNASWQTDTVTTGWVTYADTTYPNSGSAWTLTGGVDTKFNFSWGTKNDTYLPLGVDSLFNRADSTIIGKEGRALDIMLYFRAVPSSASQWVDIWVDIGGAVGELYRQTFAFPKGSGVERGILYSIPSAYTLNTWEANGGTIYVRSDANLDIYSINLNIDVEFEP